MKEIISLSKKSGTPFFTASSLRFFPGITKLKNKGEYGEILSVDAYSPAGLEPHHTDLYWYGIHGVETLYALMGPGCSKVTRVFNEDGEVVVVLSFVVLVWVCRVCVIHGFCCMCEACALDCFCSCL